MTKDTDESTRSDEPDNPKNSDNITEEAGNRPHWYDLSLVQAVLVAIFMATLVVGVAGLLYLNDSNHKFDISRPGNKYNPPQLTIDDDTEIDAQSPVTKNTLSEVTKIINDQREKLEHYGNYSDPALSSGSLDLTTKDSDTPERR